MSFVNRLGYKKKVTSLIDVKSTAIGWEAMRNNSGKTKIKCVGKHYNCLLEAFKLVKSKHYNDDGYLESGTIMNLLEKTNPVFKEHMERWRASPNKTDLRNTTFYLLCFNEPGIFANHFRVIDYWYCGRIELSDSINDAKPKIKEPSLKSYGM